MNFYLLEIFLTSIYTLGVNFPALLWAFGTGGECNNTESMSLVVGILISFCHLPYFIRIIKLWKSAANVNEFESHLTLLSPKFFPIFIYQALFLAMFESSLASDPTRESSCLCIELQETIFQITGGIYGYFWIRGALFGGFRTHVPNIARIGILFLTQLLRYLSTKLLRYAIVFKYGSDTMKACPYIAYSNMFLIIIISALVTLAFASSGLGAIGFLISGPICYTLWEKSYFMRLAGWILKKSNQNFDSEAWINSETCSYNQPNFMLWVLPFACWLLFFLVLAGIRYFMPNRGAMQIPESPNQAAEFFQKQYRLVEKLYGTNKLPEKVAEEKVCPICWENFVPNEKVSYVEECFHVYHSVCINKWIVKGPDCPLCKRRIKSKYF